MSTSGQQARKPRADVQRNRAATLYRHFPAREALPAAVLQTRSEELVTRQAGIAKLGDPVEALEQWLRVLEEYFSAGGAVALDPGNRDGREEQLVPLHRLPYSTGELGAPQVLLGGRDEGVTGERASLDRLRALIASGYRERDDQA